MMFRALLCKFTLGSESLAWAKKNMATLYDMSLCQLKPDVWPFLL